MTLSRTIAAALAAALLTLPLLTAWTLPATAQAGGERYEERYDVYREQTRPAPRGEVYTAPEPAAQQPAAPPTYGEPYAPSTAGQANAYDEPPPRGPRPGGAYEPYRDEQRDYRDEPRRPSAYSQNDIVNAGHGFFGSVSKGLANAIEYTFKNQGRPNGYILGEDAGGAFVAGLRYGEGTLFTQDAGEHKVYWQGPSLGYDFGGEGSKVMVLVYDLSDPSEIYERFGGVQGSAYLVGGVSVQLQKHGRVTLALIRSGVGLRLGANVGYLKYTRSPTWNPF